MAQRKGWRYLATRLNGDGTETLLHPDLPLEDVTVEEVLSGDWSISAKIDPAVPHLIRSDGPILREWSTALYAESDGAIRAGAILHSVDIEGPSLSLDAVGFTGYGRDMPYTGPGYYGVQVDPTDMVRLIWGHIQAQRGGNIGLQVGSANTGGKVKIGTELTQVEFDTVSGPVSFEAGPFKLAWHLTHDLQGEVDDLAAETPFDYVERHAWKADGTIGHYLDLGYPKIGRRRDDLRFVHGVNIFEPVRMSRDGSLYASGTMVLGAGEGAAMVKAISEPPTRPGNRLRRVAVVVDSSIRSKARAETRAQAENQWRARLDDVSSLVVRDHPNARLGAAKVGDEILVEGRGEWDDVSMWVRILSISYQPAGGNIAEYRVARTDKLTS